MKLVSLNIEGQKHLPGVRAFLQQENADVVCLMEVFEDTFPGIVPELYPHRIFAPNYLLDQADGVVPGNREWGVVILSKYPFTESSTTYYGDHTGGNLPHAGTEHHTPVLLMGDVSISDTSYRVGTTHFTWTPKSLPDELQRKHMQKLLDILSNKGEFVLAGDFNIPRGGEMYAQLAANYRDNIPPGVMTTLDPDLHYANQAIPGKLKLVVDYLWTTPGYVASRVRVQCGISDHCGVVAEVAA